MTSTSLHNASRVGYFGKFTLNIYAYHCQSTGLYNITDGKTATKGNELGIFESIGDIYAQEDLDEFFKVLAP